MKHVFIIGARGYHAKYGGWETFVSNLVDYYNDKNTVFHISEITDYTTFKEKKINDNIYVNPIYVKLQGSVKMFIYTIKAYKYYLKYIDKENLKDAYIYVLGLKLFNYLKVKRTETRRLGVKVYVNPDGLEHERSKWSLPIKKFFLLSERLMLNSCDLIVCDSLGIQEYVIDKYPSLKDKTIYIAYGYEKMELSGKDEDVLKEYGLIKDNYLLVVGRCVPENNLELIINGFLKSDSNKKLVIISNLSSTDYYDKLIKLVDNSDRVLFIDGVYEKEKLAYIRKNAYLYIHGHSVGGTNPSLIEALSLTDLNLLYDVCFNKYVGKDSCLYFKSENDLTMLLNDKQYLDKSKKELGKKAKKEAEDNFTWEIITGKYKKIFK